MALSPPQVELVVRREGQPERRLLLGEGTTHMGRAEDNDLVLPDIGVSRRHARIIVDTNGVTMEDMGSGNGTWFRGARVRRQAIGDGDEIVVDPFTLHFHLRSSETADSTAPPQTRADDEQTARLNREEHSDAVGTGTTPPDARIVTLAGQRLVDSYTIIGQRLTLGRSEGRDVVLFDPAASRRHCEIVARGGDYWLVDDGSANGTFVNTERVRETQLTSSDRIRIGSTEFRFERTRAPKTSSHSEPQQSTTPMAIPIRGTEEQRHHGRAPLQERPTVNRPARSRRAPRAVRLAARLMLLAVMLGFGLLVIVAVAVAANWDRLSAVATSLVGPQSSPLDGVPASVTIAGSPPPVTDPALEPTTSPLLDEGMVAFQQGRYLDAASQFYRVLQLDPAHLQAERMGYLACEYIALDTMRDTVLRRTVPAADQKRLYSDALSASDKALKGKTGLPEARAALDEALVYFPGDERASAAFKDILTLEAASRETERSRAHKKKVEKLYKLARLDADRGNHVDAVVAYEGVMAADPDKRTHYYYDARDGIVESKARLAALAEPEISAAEAARQAGDAAAAEEHFSKALELDPYSEKARDALAGFGSSKRSGTAGD